MGGKLFLLLYNEIAMEGLKQSKTNVCETVSDFNKNKIGSMDTVIFGIHLIQLIESK